MHLRLPIRQGFRRKIRRAEVLPTGTDADLLWQYFRCSAPLGLLQSHLFRKNIRVGIDDNGAPPKSGAQKTAELKNG